MAEFAGRVTLVTGAGRGLGRAVARAFAAEGAAVAANDLTPANLDPLVEEIAASGGRAKAYLADVSKKLDLQTMIAAVLEDWGRIDVLVNGASVRPADTLLEMDEWDLRRTLDVILAGTFLATQSVGRVMRELGGGVIVNLGPPEWDGEGPPRPAYRAAKGGVLALTRAAAPELAAHGVRVHAVCPRPGDERAAVEAVLDLCRHDAGRRTGEVVRP